jgi:hypothetical protein
LHVSSGGVQVAVVGGVHVSLHGPVPSVPQLAVQLISAPRMQAKVSSRRELQLSSSPLHVSAGGVQAEVGGRAQVAVQVPVPVLPHVVLQETGSPSRQEKISSVAPSQSSSSALHVSAGGGQAAGKGTVQSARQVPVPGVEHVVRQDTVEPNAQAKPSSAVMSQSSSMPLHVSPGGAQSAPRGNVQSPRQTPEPADKHEVVHETG